MNGAIRSIAKTLALLAVLGHFGAVTLAASPTLHHWLHGDEASSDHGCAVIAMLAGQLDQATALAVRVTPPAISILKPFSAAPHFPPVLLVAAKSARAPPAAGVC